MNDAVLDALSDERLSEGLEARSFAGAAAADRVGPNAIIQTGHALCAALGRPAALSLYSEAGLVALLDAPPSKMVPAAMVRRLNATLIARLDGAGLEAVMRDAGRRTGRYVLENRIPRPARALLRALPKALAGRLLLKAIKANSWTFAGDAEVIVAAGRPARILIRSNPLPMPGCPWHCAVLGTLFEDLVDPHIRVCHVADRLEPASDLFEISWSGPTRP